MHVPSCLCAALPRLPTETEIVLLTHEQELAKTTNTGRLAALCLPHARIVTAGGADGPRLDLDPDRRSFWLFPGSDAIELDAPLAHAAGSITLVVPDGTWAQSRRLVRRGGLDLPALRLPSGPPTRFRLRGGDRAAERLCTLEAVARALGIIEGHPVEAGLLDALTLMVERTLFARGLLPADEVTGGLDSRAHGRAMSRNS